MSHVGEKQRIDRIGLAAAIGAYGSWGFIPIFFKQLRDVSVLEIIAHRILWAVPLLIIIMAFRQQLAQFFDIFRRWSLFRWMLASAALISVNWLIYIWAINSDHVLAASFGYYLNPLLNMAVGGLFLGERINRTQGVTIGIAVIGVILMGYGALDTVWIGLSLAASFCAYGLVRKFAPIGAVPGLAIETSLLLPLALFGAWWFETYATTPGWNSDLKTNILLICGGAVTAIPLLLFATAARRMRFIALGFVQYIAPSLQFLCGVFLYNEPLTTSRLASFILIWMALVAFSWDALRKL